MDARDIPTPAVYEQWLNDAFDAHDKAAKSGKRDDWQDAERLRARLLDAYESVHREWNAPMIEALRR